MADHLQMQAELHQMAAQMLKAKISEKTIIANFHRKGLDTYYAEMILEHVKTGIEGRRHFWKYILSGGFLFLAGLTLTIGTYIANGPVHRYYIFGGIIVVGIMSITRGFMLSRK